ncbi:hypothetical protein I5K46_24570 [Pseudomonas aeruginosa]|uniref:hypothetical protein n=1 Tax=Pseudomonas aeruginosa TaxID=287 RepID=UPI00044CDE21|nr:hypothetical protein [Pseudomonas aeruginosa]EZO29194.1 hypothetical protein AJ61_04968 [Pseudomonas aeruginosa 3574]MBH9242767.1 hypothetical protein [Pseudomonas aeruginosa]NYU33202.1 hypothetical protein [Pseudomonas aeruginosa]HBO5114247.1 hypothetical protein [Pseudomonas aeruginosa]HCD6290683.1 hypothetical protein [Pseudomonas aeruginosa]
MDFLTLTWWFACIVLLVVMVTGGAIVMLWLRSEAALELGAFLRLQLDEERTHSAELRAEMMELQAAVRAERFYVEQLRRQVELLR